MEIVCGFAVDKIQTRVAAGEDMKKVLRKIKRILNRFILELKILFSRSKIDCDSFKAGKFLQEFSPKPTSSAVVPERSFGNEYDLTIIIPVYKAEQWIEQCLDSIIKQVTKYNIQIIAVDDGSPDNCGQILDGYKEKYEFIKVIHQENKGYSGARNVAIGQVKSKYLMFVDSDDYLPDNAIKVLMDVATKENADIVEGNGFTFNEKGKIGRIKQNNDILWGGPCLKIMKSELFSRVEFPEEYIYEDTIIGALIKPQAKKIIYLEDDVYAYRIHNESITQKKDNNPKRIDSFWIMQLMAEDAKKLGLPQINDFDALANHIVITQRRCKNLPEEVQKAVFVGMKEVIENYFSAGKSCDNRLIKSIQARNYEKYNLLCRL